MRTSFLRLLTLGGLISSVLAHDSGSTRDLIRRDAAPPVIQEDAGAVPTTFNGQEVPPMTELNGSTMKEDISKGYWSVILSTKSQGSC